LERSLATSEPFFTTFETDDEMDLAVFFIPDLPLAIALDAISLPASTANLAPMDDMIPLEVRTDALSILI
jgi:hypothetical protein